MRALRVVIFFVALIAGCIPSTRAVINIGSGYDMAAMRRAEGVLEANGFSRSYYESKSGEKQERYRHKDESISSFSGPVKGIGAGVILHDADGRLYVEFGEWNTSFSTTGRLVLNTLTKALQSEFGEKVTVRE
jgi:hypothetical protein